MNEINEDLNNPQAEFTLPKYIEKYAYCRHRHSSRTARPGLPQTPDMPTDILFTDEWYLNDINVLPVWNGNGGQGYTGKGVNIAQFEPGMPFSTGAEIFDYRHPDLQTNVDQSWIADPNANLTQTFSNHATLVAGVMVAANNGEGAVGDVRYRIAA